MRKKMYEEYNIVEIIANECRETVAVFDTVVVVVVFEVVAKEKMEMCVVEESVSQTDGHHLNHSQL